MYKYSRIRVDDNKLDEVWKDEVEPILNNGYEIFFITTARAGADPYWHRHYIWLRKKK